MRSRNVSASWLWMGLVSAMLMGPMRPRPAHALAAVWRERAVGVRAEEILVAWDERSHTEHLVYQATFRNVEGDFGLLIPTPTRPELGEVNGELFAGLERLAESRRTEEHATTWSWSALGALWTSRQSPPPARDPAGATLPRQGAVRIVARERVAGLDATVLSAADPAQLTDWLARHGYHLRPGVSGWLAPYLARGWVVTALKYVTPSTTGLLSSRAVRVSFRTDAPVVPYSEPADSPVVENRSLHLWVLAPFRMDGRVGQRAFEATLDFAVPGLDVRSAFAPDQPPSGATGPLWLSRHRETRSTRRPAEDLRLERARDQSPVPPPPRQIPRRVLVPLDVLVLLAAGALLVFRRRRARA